MTEVVVPLVASMALLAVGMAMWSRASGTRRGDDTHRRLSAYIVGPDGSPDDRRARRDGATAVPDVLWSMVGPSARVVEGLAGQVLQRRPELSRFGVVVQRSGLDLGVTEIVGASMVVTGASGALLGLLGLPLVLVAASAVCFGSLPLLATGLVARRRRRRFASDLPGLLQLLAGAVRAGIPVSQALAGVSDEVTGPVSDEFRRVATESGLGRPLPDSLSALAERVGNDDVAWVGMAIELHQQAGGNLAEVLDTVAHTITQVERLRSEVATLTAEGRVSALVLGLLPPLLTGVISVVNPGYVASLLDEPLGIAMVVGAGVAMVVGFAWMHRIVGINV